MIGLNSPWITRMMTQPKASNTTTTTANPSTFQGMLDQMQQGYQESKTANEQRYGDILNLLNQRYGTVMGTVNQGTADTLGLLGARYNTVMGDLEGYGTQRAADINAQYSGLASRGQQDLVSRGLSGTTILPTMRAGVAREQQNALNRLGESIQGMRAGYQSALLGDIAGAHERATGLTAGYQSALLGDVTGAMERRTDVGPTLSDIAQLMIQAGNTRGTGGYSGAVYPQYQQPMMGGYGGYNRSASAMANVMPLANMENQLSLAAGFGAPQAQYTDWPLYRSTQTPTYNPSAGTGWGYGVSTELPDYTGLEAWF